MNALRHAVGMAPQWTRWLGAGAVAILLVFGLDWILDPGLSLAAGASVEAHGVDTAHTFKNSKAVALLFWFLSFATLGGAVFVITRRNMVSAVMGMVATFFAIAGLYLMLYASFLAVMQVLVYAGAIMVLFVFVIMILNRPEAEPWAVQGLLGKALAGLGLLYLFKRLVSVLWQVKDTHGLVVSKEEISMLPNRVMNRSDPDLIADFGGSLNGFTSDAICKSAQAVCETFEFGTVDGVGYTLFTKYLFPFEAVSLVLLVAVVGAIAIARPDKDAESDIATETEGADS